MRRQPLRTSWLRSQIATLLRVAAINDEKSTLFSGCCARWKSLVTATFSGRHFFHACLFPGWQQIISKSGHDFVSILGFVSRNSSPRKIPRFCFDGKLQDALWKQRFFLSPVLCWSLPHFFFLTSQRCWHETSDTLHQNPRRHKTQITFPIPNTSTFIIGITGPSSPWQFLNYSKHLSFPFQISAFAIGTKRRTSARSGIALIRGSRSEDQSSQVQPWVALVFLAFCCLRHVRRTHLFPLYWHETENGPHPCTTFTKEFCWVDCNSWNRRGMSLSFCRTQKKSWLKRIKLIFGFPSKSLQEKGTPKSVLTCFV